MPLWKWNGLSPQCYLEFPSRRNLAQPTACFTLPRDPINRCPHRLSQPVLMDPLALEDLIFSSNKIGPSHSQALFLISELSKLAFMWANLNRLSLVRHTPSRPKYELTTGTKPGESDGTYSIPASTTFFPQGMSGSGFTWLRTTLHGVALHEAQPPAQCPSR